MRRPNFGALSIRLVLGLAGVTVATALQGARAPTPIKIGAYTSLTGSDAEAGKSFERGTRLAVDEVNAAGGALGRPLALEIKDTRSKAGESAYLVRTLISQEKVVAVLGEVSSSRSLEAAPICQDLRVPMISNGSNSKITEVGDFIFNVASADPFQGTIMAKFAREKLQANRVATFVDSTNPYSVSLGKSFRERFLAEGGVIAIEQRYTAGEKEFSIQLGEIKAAGVDAIFVPGYSTEVSLIALQTRQIGFTGALLGGDTWATPQLVETAGEALENTYYCDRLLLNSDSPVTQRFVSRYRERFQEDPDAVAPLAYDAVVMLANAISRAGSTKAVKLRAALANTANLAGVSGTITVDSQRNPQKSLFVVGFKDGRYQLLNAVLP